MYMMQQQKLLKGPSAAPFGAIYNSKGRRHNKFSNLTKISTLYPDGHTPKASPTKPFYPDSLRIQKAKISLLKTPRGFGDMKDDLGLPVI